MSRFNACVLATNQGWSWIFMKAWRQVFGKVQYYELEMFVNFNPEVFKKYVTILTFLSYQLMDDMFLFC